MNEIEECEYCNEKFNDLKLHLERSIKCKKYKYILFSCEKCEYFFKGINNLEKHLEYCNPVNDDYEKLYNMEKLKTNFYKKMMETQKQQITSTLPSYKITSFDENEEKEKDNDDEDEEENKKKKSYKYKSLKKCVKLSAEPSIEEKTNKVDEINKNFEIIKKSFRNIEEAKPVFEECFENIKSSRIYTKSLEAIKRTRMNIIGSMLYDDYKNLLISHTATLNNIFNTKNYVEKKIIQNVTKSLSSLDMRILLYNGYTNVVLDMDDIQKFKTCLELSVSNHQVYVPFNNEYVKYFQNYSSAVFSLKDNIERCLFNCYGLFNIIYLPINKSLDSDPYSFYILDKVEKNKRFWNMDCRLEELSNKIITNIRPYYIELFRKLYFDVFHDNEYRKNYSSTNTITENDCEQLIQNIFILSNPKKFCNYFRNIVKNKATFQASVKDKFNIQNDDPLQKKRFENTKEFDVVEIVKLLFDNITSEESVDLYREKNII